MGSRRGTRRKSADANPPDANPPDENPPDANPMGNDIQPRRNLLFVPGTRPDRFAKALAAGPDMVTVDLEDAVIPAHKDKAREQAMPLFAGQGAEGIERVVRINGLRTPFGLKDLLAIVEHPSPPDAIMLPKVEAADEVRIVDTLLQRAAPH